MTDERDSNDGWFARWREHRRGKRQQAREREYFAQEQARSYGGALASTDRLNTSGYASSYATTSTGSWGGLGGDGGCDGGGGGC